MKPVSAAKAYGGVTPSQAALVAGVAYMLSPVSCAAFLVYAKLVVASNTGQMAQTISAHLGLFAAAI